MSEAARGDNGSGDEPLVTVGRIMREWGIKGEMLAMPLTFDPERFFRLHEVAIPPRGRGSEKGHPDGPAVWKKLKSVRLHGNLLLLALEGCESPEEARRYRGALLQIKRSESPHLPEGTYYHYQIIGLAVHRVDGTHLGKVVAILETGSNDVYVVRGEGREYLIPALREAIKQIDLESKKMTVELMDSLE